MDLDRIYCCTAGMTLAAGCTGCCLIVQETETPHPEIGVLVKVPTEELGVASVLDSKGLVISPASYFDTQGA